MLVGKPGSGKTSVIKTLLNDKGYYFQKFDNVLLISPSASKMGIRVKKENMTQVFSLPWIQEKLLEINKKQKQKIIQRLRELNIIERADVEKLNGHLMDEFNTNPSGNGSHKANILHDKERFFSKNMFK